MIEVKSSTLYKIERNLLLASFALTGFGHHLFGIALPLEYSTFFILVVLALQMVSSTLRLSKFLIYIFVLITIQTFIINSSNISDPEIWSYYTGLFLLALTSFSFVSYYRNNMPDFAIAYYKMVYFLAMFSIVQIALFILFGISLIPQNLITGQLPTGSPVFIPEVFSAIPRSVGLSSEPANFAYILMPGMYLAVSQIFGEKNLLSTHIGYAWVIIFSMLLTFSLVAYYGIILTLLFVNKEKIFHNLKQASLALIVVTAVFYSLYITEIGTKFITFLNMSKEVSENRLETHSYTSYALVSNFMVALKSQKDYYYIGSGLNTHRYNYDKYIRRIFNSQQISLELNKENAGSLFIRILSEFGIIGIILVFVYIYHYRLTSIRGRNLMKTINEMALVTILLYCTRSGHYNGITFLVFGAIYYFSYKVNRKQIICGNIEEPASSKYYLQHPDAFVK